MTPPDRPLPEFDDPPVIETVLGVEFAAPEKWGVPLFGLFWNEIRADYPAFEVHAAAPGAKDKILTAALAGAPINLQLNGTPDARCWFMDQSQERLIQVQRERFIHNWRKKSPASGYPRYRTIRPRFEGVWRRFCNFLEREGVKPPEVRQCEVTYINHLERGRGWESFSDLSNVTRCWACERSGSFLPSPEGVSVTAQYLMPDQQGRLDIRLQPAVRLSDGKEVLQLALTASGPPSAPGVEGVLAWLDLGREWVVRGFDDFTSVHMHDIWGKRNQP